MDEIIKKILQSELLSEETKNEIVTEWNEKVEAFKQQLREEAVIEVRAELAEQWTKERDELVEDIDNLVTTHLQNELTELKDDIERFRDLEAEYAEKLVEAKHELADQLAAELDQLVDKIDAFFEMRISEELDEFKEDLEVVKENDFGRRMFEAFRDEFSTNYIDESSTQSKLAVSEQKRRDTEKRLAEKEKELSSMIRESKMKEVLAPLSGKKREQMEFILKNVETSKLSEAYKYFVGRVLKEEDVSSSDSKVITEDKKSVDSKETKFVTGDTKVLTEEKPVDSKKVDELSRLRKLAAISK